MNEEMKAKWLEALRSGEYEQERHALASEGFTSLCCIGVGYAACIGDPEELDTGVEDRTLSASHALGLTADQQIKLVEMNDLDGLSFAKIADWIEANL